LVHHLLLRAEIVGEAAQVRDDEVDIGILRRQHVHHVRLPGHVHQDGDAEGPRCLAHFARGHGLMPVHADPAEPALLDGALDHLADAAGVAAGVHHGEPDQPARIASHDLRQRSEGQTRGMEEVAKAVTQMEQLTRSTAARAEESAAAA
jgi:hypothetical protein